ncbi:MAG TPA: hypothetical protein VHG09_08705 [Longimicrobiales bacterium]|nr:hypothetical protein [Longimicrobiales bacterium]
MRLIRRAAALLLLVSFTSLGLAAAGCHAAGTGAVASSDSLEAHAHHASVATEAPDAGADDPLRPPTCDLMATCAVAAPALMAAAVQSGPFASDASAAAPAGAHMAPPIDFEPPPPRRLPT